MKSLLSTFVFVVAAMTMIMITPSDVSAQKYYRGTVYDTLTAAGSPVTVIMYPGGVSQVADAVEHTVPGQLYVSVQADSISGSTDALAILQYCADASCNFTHNIDTMVLNGSTVIRKTFRDDDFPAWKWRVLVTGSGTQKNAVRMSYIFRRKG